MLLYLINQFNCKQINPLDTFKCLLNFHDHCYLTDRSQNITKKETILDYKGKQKIRKIKQWVFFLVVK